jgi:hypothetical protein
MVVVSDEHIVLRGSRFHAFGLLDLPSRSCRFLGDDLHQTGPHEAEVTT